MEQFDQNNFVQNEPAQIKSPHMVWAIVITAILVAVLVGFGVYMLQLQRIKSLETQLIQTNQILKTLASKSVLTSDNTATNNNINTGNNNTATVTNKNINTTTNNPISPVKTISSVSSQDIKNAFSKKYPKIDYSSYTIKIDKYTDTYARGSVSSGAGWFAKKINGVWTVVADGQAIECSALDNYGFPKDFQSVYCG